MCGRPRGFKSLEENSGGRLTGVGVSPWPRGKRPAGPDGVRDPVPNNPTTSRATGSNGFFGSSVRPIVISVSSCTLASTRGSDGDRLVPAALPRVIVADISQAVPLFNHGRNHAVARSPEARKDRIRQSPARPPL